jgi:flagellar basal-body rod protein FlgG
MIKGIYSSGSGMGPRLMGLDVIANNIANADTTGFKKNDVFVQILKDAGVAQSIGKGEMAGLDVKEFTDFSEGSHRSTSNPLDLAVHGEGFFVLDTPQGMRYTRNGNFKLSEGGDLVNSNGQHVMGTSGRINFPNAAKTQMTDLVITTKGEMYMGKDLVGKLRLVTFADLQQLQKEAGSVFTTDQQTQEIQFNEERSAVRQGYLEESNVESLTEMVQLVEFTRNFETDQRTMRYQDSTLEKALEVGRL